MLSLLAEVGVARTLIHIWGQSIWGIGWTMCMFAFHSHPYTLARPAHTAQKAQT